MVGSGSERHPGRRQAQVAGATRVRLRGQPRLDPAKGGIAVGYLDRDRQPALQEAPDLARKRRNSAAAEPITISVRPPEKNGF